jgi:hypothetical protein
MRLYEFDAVLGLRRVLPPVFQQGGWGRAVVEPPAKPAVVVQFPKGPVFTPRPAFVARGL